MLNRKAGLFVAVVSAVTVAVVFLNPLMAEPQAAKREKKVEQGREMTFVGKIVDLQNFMNGKYPSDDKAKCTADALKAGVPAAIDTPSGLVVIGQAGNSPSKTLIPLAFTRAKVSGKYYEKNGLKYIDIASASSAAADAADVEPSEE